MKKRVLYSMMVLALVLGMALSMVAPVMAQATSSLTMTLVVDPSATNSEGTLYYTVTLTNQAVAGANDADVDVTFYPPGPTGAQGAYGAPVVLDTDRVIVVGETVTYNWDGSGGAEARPALAVDLGAIPLDEGVAVVYAASEFDGVYLADPSYDAHSEKTIPATVIWPDTQVTIAASETTVDSGGSVSLTVTERNIGDVDLTDPHVEVRKNGGLLATLTAPPDSGDAGWVGVLDVGETWTWTIDSGPITATTTFEALGFGTDSLGNEISYAAGYLDERDEVRVLVDKPPPVGGDAFPVSRLAILAPWVALGAAIIAGAVIFARRRQAQS